MNGYYITVDKPNEKIILEPQDEIYLCDMNLIELVLPECKLVWCRNNNLTELIVPKGCEYVNCAYNNLTKLVLPNSVKQVHCAVNLLTELIIPWGCDYVSCSHNNLIKLIIPNSCKTVLCNFNKLHPIIIDLFQSEDPIKIQLANNLQLVNKLQQ
jgi:hypothetical protein